MENTQDARRQPRVGTSALVCDGPLRVIEHQFRPTTGVAAADDYIRQAIADVMRDMTPLIVERVTDKMARLLEAKKLPRRSHTQKLTDE